MAASNWVVKINEQLESMVDTSTEMEHWRKRSIYKIPSCVTDLNRKAYIPQAVSFGPYHHGKDHLRPMEEHKHRALLHFLKRSRKPLQPFVESLKEVVQVLKDCYDQLDVSWQEDTDGFLQLMILDGCFMLELLRLYIMPYIRRDMLMLENQLPILLLNKLMAVESDKAKDEGFVNKLILKFCFFSSTHFSTKHKCLHVLDVYRKSILFEENLSKKKSGHRSSGSARYRGDSDDIIRSATELNEAGIWDISFHGGVLKLPTIVVDDATESIFLNLIAFERLHVGAGNEVTSYVFFMDNIIDSAKDVALLHSQGIIQNAIGSDKAVAKLFNSLSKDITLDPESSLYAVHKKVNAYCKKSWNEWRANLIHTYFRNPWAIMSLIAAAFLFALTIAQTIYTVYPYYHPSDPSPSRPNLPSPRHFH
ncbi:hypothetical protein K2173_010060 [Erythroxylum novogranatense]|uniref:Uncharacterized protein n=1 Tax=Erythroxylum novogranatense TaxID=1862640 RepID=A0AAV8T1D4_9ROSI|nr:hypothetical protein K2173_010060 [Erythroxylum novogranatense]